jgi:hypothetical protein
MIEICAQETSEWAHLLLGGRTRTFTPDFYDALEAQAMAFAGRLIHVAGLFAQSRSYSRSGIIPVPGRGTDTLCETDFNQAWALIIQDDSEQ